MDINGVGQGNSSNMSYTIDVNSSSDVIIKEVKKSELIDKEYDKCELDKALKQLNKFLEDEKSHAEYSVHKDLGTIMIKVINDKTKDVIMELPPKKILDMVASMCKQCGIFDKKA